MNLSRALFSIVFSTVLLCVVFSFFESIFTLIHIYEILPTLGSPKQDQLRQFLYLSNPQFMKFSRFLRSPSRSMCLYMLTTLGNLYLLLVANFC